jgi:hypothetical protein
MRAHVKRGRRSSGIAGLRLPVRVRSVPPRHPRTSESNAHRHCDSFRHFGRHFAATATRGRSAPDVRASAFDNLPRVVATSAAMNRLVLVFALVSLASCVTARVPELRVEWSSGRQARESSDRGAQRWRNEGHARLVWPLAPPPTAPPLPPRSTRPATPLPQASVCVDPRLCTWEREARRRAWARHVRSEGRPR